MREISSDGHRKAFHLMLEAQEVRGGKTLRFFQNLVIYADSAVEAKARATSFMARQGALVLEFDEEETYESDPARVGYETSMPEEGIVGMTGRMYFPVGQASLIARLREGIAALLERFRA